MNSHDPYLKTFWRLASLLLLLTFLSLSAGRPLPSRAAGPYVVGVVSDGPDSNLGDGVCYDGVNGCTLRAALQQAAADGGGTTITFAPELTGATLAPFGVYGTLIWAGNYITLDGESRGITISGQNLNVGQNLLQIQGSHNTIRNLTLRSSPGDAIQVGDYAGVGGGNENTIEQLILIGNAGFGVFVHGGGSGGGQSNTIQNCVIGAGATATACVSGEENYGGIGLDDLAHGTMIYTNRIVCSLDGYGIDVNGHGGNPQGVIITGNYIGTNGGADMGNAYGGILIESATGTQINHNYIGGNAGHGVRLQAATNTILIGNRIGNNGTVDIPNDMCGVALTDGASANRVGGTAPADRNVIGGNKSSGVCLAGGATGNTVEGNYIGTDALGTGQIANGEAGVSIIASDGNYIGSALPDVVQLISGNKSKGIYIQNASGNQVGWTAWIGVDSSGVNPLGNGEEGVMLVEVNDTFVGSAVIAFNGDAGVALTGAGMNNTLTPSSVHHNGGLPIDLGNDGPTPNDPGDGDGGPNGLLNYPEITGGSGSDVWGTVCNGCTVLIYEADGNPRAAGGGGSLVMQVGADVSGAWSASLPYGLTAADITTVACEGGCGMAANTSEMSPLWGASPLAQRVFLPLVVRH